MSIVLTLLLKLWPYILGAAGVAYAALRVRQSGVNAEKAKEMAAEAKARDVADQVQNDIGALPADAARKELGQWSPKS